MRWWRRKKAGDEDLERDLRAHLELEAQELHEAGVPKDEAHYAARRALGNTTSLKEEMRAMWRWTSLERVAQDARYVLRMLRRNPAFAIAAILTLTLGIGANTAIFSLVNAVLLRPLPFRDPGGLMSFWGENPQLGFMGPASVCDPDFLTWRQQNRSFSEIAAFHAQTANLTGSGTPERLLGSAVTVNLFHLLGREPALGRAFLADEATAGHDNVVLLNQKLWARYFLSERSILGRSITLDNRAFTVVGVMPADFQFPSQADFWTPLKLSGDCSNASNQVIARLRPGISQGKAQNEVNIIAHRLAQERHRGGNGWKTSLVSLQEQMSAKLRPTLLLLLCAVGVVLLIACANVANLLLARGTARQHEMATRRALGASRGRIAGQLLAESLCLALIAGSLGLLFSFLARHALVSLLPSVSNQPGFMQPVVNNAIDIRVLSFVFLSSIGAGILFGLAPALQSPGLDLLSALKDSRAVARSASRLPSARNAFIVAEVALTLVLLVAAGLLTRSFIRLRTLDPGFVPDRILTATLELPETRYRDESKRISFHNSVLDRLDSLPGIRHAGTVSFGLPFSGGGLRGDITVEGQPPPPPELSVSKLVVSPGYFPAMGIPLLKGRAFSGRDTNRSTPAVMVNASFVRQFFPNESPIGKRINPGFTGSPLYQVIGVVGDVKEPGHEKKPPIALYLPYSQAPWPFLQAFVTIVVRTRGEPLTMTNDVREAVQSVDPEIPVFDVASMGQLISKSVSEPRTNMLVVGLFAALALILATVGIYGVITYSVTQRTREIAIRAALGATRAQVLTIVVRQGLALTLVGVALGLVASLAVTRLLANRLYEIQATDPETFLVVILLLIATSVVASLLAARRAARVDPMVALRYE
jgi:predicted permease